MNVLCGGNWKRLANQRFCCPFSPFHGRAAASAVSLCKKHKYIYIYIYIHMGAAGVILLLDVILVPTSLFITIGYHAYLWHRLRHKPCLATIGLNSIKRRSWLQQLNQASKTYLVYTPKTTSTATATATIRRIIRELSYHPVLASYFFVTHSFNHYVR